MTRQPTSRLILFLFFLSGASALILEVTWAKQLRLVFGNSTFAISSILTAFMLGLGFGSAFFGRWTSQENRSWIKVYGLTEAFIGIYVLLFPLLLRLATPLYASAYTNFETNYGILTLIRFLLSLGLLFIPTFLMGGTFPLIAQSLSDANISRLNKIYFMNLLGAAFGAGLAGFILLPVLGIKLTAFIAATTNFLIAVAVFRGVRITIESVTEPAPAVTGRLPRQFVVAASMTAFIQGLCAFAAQIAWTRIFALMFGSSVYTFSMVLVILLLSLAASAYVVHRWRKKGIAQLPATGLAQILFGTAVLAMIPVWEWLIFLFTKHYSLIKGSWFSLFGAQIALGFAALALPCFCMGLVLPTIFEGRVSAKQGSWAGTVCAWNTFGAVLGASMGSLFLMSTLGAVDTLKIAAALSIGTGMVWIVVFGRTRKVLWRGLASLVIAATLFAYPFNKPLFSAGLFNYAQAYEPAAQLGKRVLENILSANNKLIFYKDGISSTVSVLESIVHLSGGKKIVHRGLRVNGKTDASTLGDIQTQMGLAFLPLSANPQAVSALVIGLGGGMTLSGVLSSERIQNVDCLEIEPVVVEAQRFFVRANRNALGDKRVRLLIGDGRNHTRYSEKKYDIIVSEPSNPWIAGVSSLYTQEAFSEIRSRLSPGGVYCQWFHAYNLSKEDFSAIVATFASVFPQANLFRLSESDYALLGSESPLVFDLDFPKRADIFLRNFVFANDDLRQWISANPSYIHTDDRMQLEYSAPRSLHRQTSDANLKSLFGSPRHERLPKSTRPMPAYLAGEIFSKTASLAYNAGNYQEAAISYSAGLAARPDLRDLEFLGRAFARLGQLGPAFKIYDALAENPSMKDRAGWLKGEAALLWRSLEGPLSPEDMRILSGYYYLLGEPTESLRWLLQVLTTKEVRVDDYESAAKQSLLRRDILNAERYLNEAKKMEPGRSWESAEKSIESVKERERVELLLAQGRLYLRANAFEEARRVFKKINQSGVEENEAKMLLSNAEAGIK